MRTDASVSELQVSSGTEKSAGLRVSDRLILGDRQRAGDRIPGRSHGGFQDEFWLFKKRDSRKHAQLSGETRQSRNLED